MKRGPAMPTEFPLATSRCQFIGGRWFMRTTHNTTSVVLVSEAQLFKNGDRMIDAREGLSPEDTNALRKKFGDVIGAVAPDVHSIADRPEFTLPLVPLGTVVDITPE